MRRIVLTGPTAVGKTALSLEVAAARGWTVISADSRQCYRYLDIGTGKVTPEERARVPHENIDLFDPTGRDSAAAFAGRAAGWEAQAEAAGRPAFLVGGSTLHVQAVVWPMDVLPPASEANQAELALRAERVGPAGMKAWLAEVDASYAAAMDGYNPARVFRALDVWMQTGRPFSSFHRHAGYRVPASTRVLVLTCGRDTLWNRIGHRVRAMFAAGLVEETRAVLARGVPPQAQALKTVGYAECVDLLAGRCTTEEALERVIINTRRYAKRQLTWFRRWEGVEWIDTDRVSAAECRRIVERHG